VCDREKQTINPYPKNNQICRFKRNEWMEKKHEEEDECHRESCEILHTIFNNKKNYIAFFLKKHCNLPLNFKWNNLIFPPVKVSPPKGFFCYLKKDKNEKSEW